MNVTPQPNIHVRPAASSGFLDRVDQNFRHATTFLDQPEGLAEPIIQCNSTHKVRFGVPLRGRMYSFIGWRSVQRLLSEEDSARVTVVAVRNGFVANPEGPAIEALKEHQLRTGSILGSDAGKSFAGDMTGIERPCDVLIPAAMESAIHGENAESIKAHIVGEAGQQPGYGLSSLTGSRTRMQRGRFTRIPVAIPATSWTSSVISCAIASISSCGRVLVRSRKSLRKRSQKNWSPENTAASLTAGLCLRKKKARPRQRPRLSVGLVGSRRRQTDRPRGVLPGPQSIGFSLLKAVSSTSRGSECNEEAYWNDGPNSRNLP